MTPEPEPGPSRGALELVAIGSAAVAVFYGVWYCLGFAQWLVYRV